MKRISLVMLIMLFVGEGLAQSSRSKRPKPARHNMVELFKNARGNSVRIRVIIDSLRSHSMNQNAVYAEEAAAPDANQAAEDLTFMVAQNYPNPFNPSTTISYHLPAISWVTLTVYNVLGQEISTLVNEEQGVGRHQSVWNASGFASGMYICQLKRRDESGTSSVIRRTMILLK